jgi:predicted O-methyltransferase YrrM
MGNRTATLRYRFSASDELMRIGAGIRAEGVIRVTHTDIGCVLYGQYVPLPPGRYTATLQFHSERPCLGSAVMDVCAEFGARDLGRRSITAAQLAANGMSCSLDFSSADAVQNVEVRLGTEGGFVAEIQGLEIAGELAAPFSRVEVDDLPAVPVENTLSNRRSLYDGYRRGWGLQFTDLMKKVQRDPDYREARELAGNRTILGDPNLCNFFLLLKFFAPRLAPGHVVEFGCYKGGGAIFMASLARKFLPERRVFGFDTFAGMPPTDQRVDLHQPGDFGGVDLAELRQYVKRIGLDNLEFVRGDFADTAMATLQQAGRISFVHLDCDIRSAIQCAYETTKPHMVSGGYWIFDDPTVAGCLGAAEAMEDLLIRRDGLNSEQVFPHYVFRQP